MALLGHLLPLLLTKQGGIRAEDPWDRRKERKRRKKREKEEREGEEKGIKCVALVAAEKNHQEG